MSFAVNRISNMSIIPPQLIQKRSSELSLNIGMQGSKQQLFNLKTIQIRNAKKQSFHEKKIIIVESLMTLINIFVISITIFKSLNTFSDEDFDETSLEQSPRYENENDKILFLFSICVVSLNIVRNICILQLKDQDQNVSEHNEKFYFGFSVALITQSVFYFIHPSFFMNNLTVPLTNPSFQLNKLLSCIVYLRFFVILRFLLKLSRFYGLRVNRVLSLYVGDQRNFGMLYTIKCYLKHHGLKSPFIIYTIIIILIFPFFVLGICQRFSSDEENFKSSAGAFLEAIYDILISMVTIGYGDLKHEYIFERLTFVLVIVVGSLSSTFFTLTFLKWFTLSQQEEKALRTIKRLQIKKSVESINNKQVKQFVRAFVNVKKEKLKKRFNRQDILKKRQSFLRESISSRISKNLPDLKHNQNLTPQKQKIDAKNLERKIFEPQKKYLHQRLYDTRDTFRDQYERSHLELSNSLKLLIQRTLLTNNLLEFYLMRQKNNTKFMQSSSVSDSSETIKSRKRVDDNKKMYEIRNLIVKCTLQTGEQSKSKKLLTKQSLF